MIKGERSLEGKKLDNVAYNTPNLLLRLLKRKPGNRKINIICPGVHMEVSEGDNVILKCDKIKGLFELEDYDLPYGDIMEMYIPLEVKSLDDVSQELANLINNDEVFEKYTSIVLIGVGEGGLYIVNATKFLQRPVRIATIATPFKGTLIADAKFVRHKVKNPVIRLFGCRQIRQKFDLPNAVVKGTSFITESHFLHLNRHQWINFVATSSRYEEKNLSDRLENDFIRKVFDNCRNDGLIPIKSQECKSKELDNQFFIRVSHENALLKALEYFRS